jgi:alkane 1-monooxygenase
MMRGPTLKLAGFALCLGMPLLTPLGVRAGSPWLAAIVVFGLFPILGLLVGEDHSLPKIGLRRSRALVAYLDNLPRMYAAVWVGTLAWAADYAARSDLSAGTIAGLMVSVGIGSAVALPTAHELLHRRSGFDGQLARLMTALCCYGQMAVEHFHHHATVGEPESGATARRGVSVYRFAVTDFVHGLRNAWKVERSRLRRSGKSWWHNQVVRGYSQSVFLFAVFLGIWGRVGGILFLGQAVFAVFVFEVITYLHHYGLVRNEGEEAGPQHAWAHHCWITNCLTFNNTFHSDHHLRPRTPYYELHAMHGAPRLPASYFTMFCVALVPPLWFILIDPRLDAFAQAISGGSTVLPEWLRAERCR